VSVSSFSIVTFFYKLFTAGNHPIRALIVALLLPLLAFVFDHAARCAATVYRRLAQYEPLRELLSTTQADLNQTKQQLSTTESLVRELVVASRRIEIGPLQLINGRAILILKPKKSMRLQRGNRVQVIDFLTAQ